MIIPSIDLERGRTVQLVGGEKLAIDAGDPLPLAERFALAGDIAVIDLDAARGEGDNRALIEPLLQRARCRVGGGIRDVDSALDWLDRGAHRVILGTAATPDLLAQLPRERVLAAVDARDGEVVVDGWRRGTGESLEARLRALAPHVGGFLVTFVEREGRLGGVDLARVEQVLAACREADDAQHVQLTVAGGVRSTDEIAALDRLGVDAQVGMALYTDGPERIELADAIAAPLVSDRPDGLWATVVTDEGGRALGLAWSSRESLAAAVATRAGVYHSRRRGVWKKGETSGARQDLVRIELDCDRDAMRFVVRQHGAGFCHLDKATCWGDFDGLAALENTLAERRRTAPTGSYSAKLFADPELLGEKLREEAAELGEALAAVAVHGDGDGRREALRWEAADLAFFLTAALQAGGLTWNDVGRELDGRAAAVRRRDGSRKDGAS